MAGGAADSGMACLQWKVVMIEWCWLMMTRQTIMAVAGCMCGDEGRINGAMAGFTRCKVEGIAGRAGRVAIAARELTAVRPSLVSE